MILTRRSVMVLLSSSPEETFRIGKVLADILEAGDVVALTGELGSGKTCLTQGIANGLGVPEDYVVTSPTFTLINEYPGRQANLYHLDVYRLTGWADLAEMGYDEYLSGRGIMVVEWAEKVLEVIPDDAFFVVMTYLDENMRRIEFSGCRNRIDSWKRVLKKAGF
jgi:tRNA threonylcarbamoyladenosine biosynthesis protein TsaE